ncbi:MAG: prepilin-type N-terminal cleavage/methylation domain-containing protein [Akkermansiaceae bacterium]
MKTPSSIPTTSRKGFTLIETVIAMGIIAIMITAFMAAFGPAVQGIRKSLSVKEANRLASTLEIELSTLRPGDQATDYTTKFAKAFEWIEESGGTTKDNLILIYQYRGDPASVRADGTLEPQTDRDKQVPGVDYVLQSVCRRVGDTETEDELQPGVVEGRVFLVRMTQLVYNSGELQVAGAGGAPGGMGEIIDPTEPRSSVTNHEDYPEAVIAFQAQFYTMKSSLFPYILNGFQLDDDNGDGHPDDAGKPVFSRNMAIRR